MLHQALRKGFSKEDIRELPSVKDQCPYSLVDVVDALLLPTHLSGIEPSGYSFVVSSNKSHILTLFSAPLQLREDRS